MNVIDSDKKKYRSLFVSDIHLGSKNCQAEAFLDFLKHNEADTYYLIGDIIDFWRLRKKPYWPQSHNDVMQKLLRKVRKGAKIVYVPGNHDEALRDFCDHSFGGIEMARSKIYESVDGRRFLILHGDEFDVVVLYAKWLAHLGDWAYETSVTLNKYFNIVRRRLGLPYWSLSAYLKHKVKGAVSFIGDYEKTLAHEAKRRNADGVICGHIHHAAKTQIEGIEYMNTGDWVESCTAIAETMDGQFEIIHWHEIKQKSAAKDRLIRVPKSIQTAA
jgi:UDP-2,3-diacylglucosamine pyrophosphatase LpxH